MGATENMDGATEFQWQENKKNKAASFSPHSSLSFVDNRAGGFHVPISIAQETYKK